jgi:hypothetical protein
MALHATRLNDRGVSEAIGFMLIFGMVIAGIGLVTLYGYPLLLQQQVSADQKIMEKNMIVLQNDIKSLAYKTVPFKETSLKIGGGSLTVYNSSSNSPSSTFSISNSNGDFYVSSFNPGELRYESMSSQTDLSLQNGAVVYRRHADPGSVMLAEPRWFFDEPTNTMVVNLINITSDTILSKEGIGTVQMSLVGEPYYNETVFPLGFADYPISVEFTNDSVQDYSVAWNNYFKNSLNLFQPVPPTTKYSLPFDQSKEARLVIKKFEVKIKAI